MSDSEEGQIEIQEDGQLENDGSKKLKIKKKRGKGKKNKKQGKGGQFISSTYRKQKCEFYNKGNCVKGNLCTYSHDFQPDTAKKICKFYLSGSCSKGNECQYSHNTKIYPCKFFHIQCRCNLNVNCRFSHSPISPDFYQEYMKDNKDFILKLYKQNKLPNKVQLHLSRILIEFIENELPKKETSSLPMIQSTSNPIVKTDNNTVWTNALKKDPRQRIKPKPQEPEIITPSYSTIIKQEQEKIIEVKQESLDQKFLKNLKCYFYSYY